MMGFAKRQMERQDGLGYSAPADVHVCLTCIDNDYIRDRLEGSETSESCHFCRRRGTAGPIGIPFESLLEIIGSAITSEYTDPANVLPWESAEGGWQGATTDARDIVEDLEPFTENEELREAVIDAFSDRTWCERDYFATSTLDALHTAWKGFCNLVKHRSRFFFRDNHEDEKYNGAGDISAAEFLDHLGDAVRKLGLVREIPTTTPIYRARVHAAAEVVNSASALGPPLNPKTSNRMSPVGVSMFYGALESETAQLEVLPRRRVASRLVSTARWNALRELRVLDLRGTLRIPSEYDEEDRWLRQYVFFLLGFAKDISAPIFKDGSAHVEYVPTQVVTEYFRDVFREFDLDGPLAAMDRGRCDGILYRSAIASQGNCVVLFADAGACVEGGASKVTERGPRASAQPLLALDASSISRRPIADAPRPPRTRRRARR